MLKYGLQDARPDKSHSSQKVRHWCRAQKVKRMDRPVQSPDLNPIENLWYQVSCLMSKNKEGTLIEQVIAAWFRVISLEKLIKLVDSSPQNGKMVFKIDV